MAITAQQERELLNAMQDYVDTTKRADKFLKDGQLQSSLIGRIAIEITQIHHMSVTEARSYIDGRTGRFQPGIRLHVCPSDKIQGLFNQLEAVTTDINNAPISFTIFVPEISTLSVCQITGASNFLVRVTVFPSEIYSFLFCQKPFAENWQVIFTPWASLPSFSTVTLNIALSPCL